MNFHLYFSNVHTNTVICLVEVPNGNEVQEASRCLEATPELRACQYFHYKSLLNVRCLLLSCKHSFGTAAPHTRPQLKKGCLFFSFVSVPSNLLQFKSHVIMFIQSNVFKAVLFWPCALLSTKGSWSTSKTHRCYCNACTNEPNQNCHHLRV